MYHTDNPNDMTTDQLFNEIAIILSKGYIRLKQREIMEVSEKAYNTEVSLDSFADQSAHEHRG